MLIKNRFKITLMRLHFLVSIVLGLSWSQIISAQYYSQNITPDIDTNPQEQGALVHPINIDSTPSSYPLFLQSKYPKMSQQESDKFNKILKFLIEMGETNYARLLEQNAQNGKISFGEMDSSEGGETDLSGNIKINEIMLQTAGTRPMTFSQMANLAATLIHEYSHTLQSYLEKTQAGPCPGDFCEVEAWGAGIAFLARLTNTMVDKVNQAQKDGASDTEVQELVRNLGSAAGAFTTYEDKFREGEHRPWTGIGRGSGDYTWTDSSGTKFSSKEVVSQAQKLKTETNKIDQHEPGDGPLPKFTGTKLPEMSSTGVGSYTTPPEAPKPEPVVPDNANQI